MYRVGLEQLLGFTKTGNTLVIRPRVPAGWPGYSLTYRFGATDYEISVVDPAGIQARAARVQVDGVLQATGTITLVDDGARHVVVVSAVA
jgi:cellobiose phosphorylase